MTSGSTATQAESTDRAKLLARLRGSSFGALVMLILQFALGAGVNLYIEPTKGGFGEAFSNGPLLAIHALLGLLLIIAAIGQLVLSIRARHGAIIAISAVGLIAILIAASSGAGFLSDHAEGESLAMALAAAVAMLCYAACLRIESERPLQR
jgi:O-antigen/teichoic acid export membrane protein